METNGGPIMKETITRGNEKGLTLLIRRTIQITIILFGAVLMSFNASARDSELKLSMWNNSSFIVEIGNECEKVRENFITDGLRAGKHRLKITQPVVNIHTGRKKMKVVYNGFVNIQKNTRIVAIVMPNNRLDIVRRIRLRNRTNSGCHQMYESVPYAEEPIHFDDYDEYHGDHYDHNPGYTDHHNDPYDDGLYLEDVIMNQNSFENLVELLSEEWFDSRRLATAKNAIKNNTFSAEQVKQLIETFTFESSKLEIAKFSYDHTIDKENYYIIFSTLNYNSSVNELEIWINEVEN